MQPKRVSLFGDVLVVNADARPASREARKRRIARHLTHIVRFLPRECCVARGVLPLSSTDTTNRADNKRLFHENNPYCCPPNRLREPDPQPPRDVARPARSQPTIGERSRFARSSHTTTSLTRRLRPTGFLLERPNVMGEWLPS
jgi:hypothetical protein